MTTMTCPTVLRHHFVKRSVDLHFGPKGMSIDDDADVGRGAIINDGVTIDQHAILGRLVLCYKDVTIRGYATVNDGSVLETGVVVGADACITQNVRIGSNTTILNGTFVHKSIPANCVVTQRRGSTSEVCLFENTRYGRLCAHVYHSFNKIFQK